MRTTQNTSWKDNKNITLFNRQWCLDWVVLAHCTECYTLLKIVTPFLNTLYKLYAPFISLYIFNKIILKIAHSFVIFYKTKSEHRTLSDINAAPTSISTVRKLVRLVAGD
jgi:hypothetical protein